MYGSGEELFSGSAFSGKQYGRRPFGYSAGSQFDLAESLAFTDDIVKSRGTVILQQPLGDAKQAFIGVEGFDSAQKLIGFPYQGHIGDKMDGLSAGIAVLNAFLVDGCTAFQGSGQPAAAVLLMPSFSSAV